MGLLDTNSVRMKFLRFTHSLHLISIKLITQVNHLYKYVSSGGLWIVSIDNPCAWVYTLNMKKKTFASRLIEEVRVQSEKELDTMLARLEILRRIRPQNQWRKI